MTYEPSVGMRYFLVMVGCFQNLLMGGVIFGWAAISNTMLISDSGAPGLNPSHIHQMFIMGTSANMCSPLFLGIALDKYGPRVASVLSIMFSFSGFMLFSFTDSLIEQGFAKSRETVFSLSIILIGFGGPGVQNAVIHLANLFPARKGLVTAIITGCFQLSFVVFFIFDQLWFFGDIDYRDIFFGHACLCLVALVASVVLWPDKPFHFDVEVKAIASPNESPSELTPPSTPTKRGFARAGLKVPSNEYRDFPSPSTYDKGRKSHSTFSLIRYPSFFQHAEDEESVSSDFPTAFAPASSSPSTATIALRTKLHQKNRPKDAPLMVQLKSMQFICATSLLTVSSFWANFYIGAVDLQLSAEDYMSVHDQATCMRWFTIITTAGVLSVPFVGSAIDSLGFRKTLMITLSLGCFWSVCTLAADKAVLIFSFCVYAVFRTFLFNYYFTFVADRLGFRYFGILAGVSFFIAALFGLLQAPLLAYIQSPCVEFGESPEECAVARWRVVNLVKLATIASLYGFTWRPNRSEITERPYALVSDYGSMLNKNTNYNGMLESVVLESR